MACVNDQYVPGRRFGPDFVTEQRSKFDKRPPEQRQLTYDIAVNEDCAAWREWLDDQLARLTKPVCRSGSILYTVFLRQLAGRAKHLPSFRG